MESHQKTIDFCRGVMSAGLDDIGIVTNILPKHLSQHSLWLSLQLMNSQHHLMHHQQQQQHHHPAITTSGTTSTSSAATTDFLSNHLHHHHFQRKSYNCPSPIYPNNPSENECKLVDYREQKVAAFIIAGQTMLCLPQAFDLFLKDFVGGLFTVYAKLKKLNIVPLVCNVEHVRVLRGLGALQPGVNRCKLISCNDFDLLYRDCTTSSSRPGRPPKKGPDDMPIHITTSDHNFNNYLLSGNFCGNEEFGKETIDSQFKPTNKDSFNDKNAIADEYPLANGRLTDIKLNKNTDSDDEEADIPSEPIAYPIKKQPEHVSISIDESQRSSSIDRYAEDVDDDKSNSTLLTDSEFNTIDDIDDVPYDDDDDDDDNDDDGDDDDYDLDNHDTDYHLTSPSHQLVDPFIVKSNEPNILNFAVIGVKSVVAMNNLVNYPSTESLICHIQDLLQMATDNTRQYEKQIFYEKSELKMDVLREREVKDVVERQLSREKRLRSLYQKRFRKERKMRVLLQRQLDQKIQKLSQMESTIKSSSVVYNETVIKIESDDSCFKT